jgi:hypothetical protein
MNGHQQCQGSCQNNPQKYPDEPGDEGMMPNNKFKWLTQFLATDGAGAHKT